MKKILLTIGMAFFLVMPFFAQEEEVSSEVPAVADEVTNELPPLGMTKITFVSNDGTDFPVYTYGVTPEDNFLTELCNSNSTITVPDGNLFVVAETVAPKWITVKKSIKADGGVQTWEVSKGNKATFVCGNVILITGSLVTGVALGFLEVGLLDGAIDWTLVGPIAASGVSLICVGIPLNIHGAGKFKRIDN